MADEQLDSTSVFFDVPMRLGGGRFHIGTTRKPGGFAGRVAFDEQTTSGKGRRLFAAWINYKSEPMCDRVVIRKAIAQALTENWFSESTELYERELNMDTEQYAGALEFFE